MQAAADIAQDTMLNAYRCWADITHPKAWVHTAASRALIRKIASAEEPVEDVPGPTSLLARPDHPECFQPDALSEADTTMNASSRHTPRGGGRSCPGPVLAHLPAARRHTTYPAPRRHGPQGPSMASEAQSPPTSQDTAVAANAVAPGPLAPLLNRPFPGGHR